MMMMMNDDEVLGSRKYFYSRKPNCFFKKIFILDIQEFNYTKQVNNAHKAILNPHSALNTHLEHYKAYLHLHLARLSSLLLIWSGEASLAHRPHPHHVNAYN